MKKKTQVTNSELRELTNELIREYGSQKAFDILDEDYEIVLEIEPKHPNKELNKFILMYAVESERREDNVIFRGSAMTTFNNHVYDYIPNSFKYISEWSDSYRRVYFSEEDLADICTCEGDLTVVLYDDLEAYLKGYEKAKEFYDEY